MISVSSLKFNSIIIAISPSQFPFSIKGDLEELLGEDPDLLKQVQFEQRNEGHREREQSRVVNVQRKMEPFIAIRASTPQAGGEDAITRRPAPDDFVASTAKKRDCGVRASTSRARYSGAVNTDGASTSGRRDCDELMDVSSTGQYKDPLLSSTPRVVLKPLSESDLPNVSRITPMDVDSDSD